MTHRTALLAFAGVVLVASMAARAQQPQAAAPAPAPARPFVAVTDEMLWKPNPPTG
jgi:hypothetical protein